ncbi:MAG: hypothetical protein EBU66_18195 [Bacteroidetes bacterium]|nr:hypothetical protein [bacterium]NBP66564.1 hypothetical protein [Bacteroidota bacterium]
MRQTSVGTQNVEGHIIEVDYIEEDDEFYYELYLNNDCINLGEPIYEKPTSKQIENYVKKYLQMNPYFA